MRNRALPFSPRRMSIVGVGAIAAIALACNVDSPTRPTPKATASRIVATDDVPLVKLGMLITATDGVPLVKPGMLVRVAEFYRDSSGEKSAGKGTKVAKTAKPNTIQLNSAKAPGASLGMTKIVELYRSPITRLDGVVVDSARLQTIDPKTIDRIEIIPGTVLKDGVMQIYTKQ